MSIIKTIEGIISTSCKSPGRIYDSILFIFSGESNSGGYAVNSDCTSWELDPRPCVQILNNNTLTLQNLQIGVNNLIGHTGLPENATHGWENGLADLVDNGQFYQSRVYLLKTGQGGSVISQWAIGDTYMNTFVSRYNAISSLLSGINYKTVIFYSQAINDAIAGTDPSTWKAATISHFADLRSIVGVNTPILMTKIMTPGQTGTYGLFNTKMDEICAADPYSFTIDTTGATQRDANHWDYAGMKLIASRMVQKFQELIVGSNFRNSVIVCDGNSLTRGYQSSNPLTKSYPAVLGTILPFSTNGTTITNKGVDAQTTQNMINDASTDIDPLYNSSVLSMVIAWEIGNDLYFNGSVSGAQTRFQTYCQQRLNIGWKVASVTVPYRDASVTGGGISPAGDTDIVYNSKRQTINNWLRANYSTFSNILIDLDANSNLGSYNTTYFNADHIHFNDLGYALIANIVSTALLNS